MQIDKPSPPTMKCPPCEGTGEVHDRHPCSLCNGTGQAVCHEVFDDVGDDGTLVFKFPSRNAALVFKTFLSCGGEQSFFSAQSVLVEEGDVDEADVVSEFVYHTGDNTVIAR